ncbi:MAG: tyrosine-type recombinase/integrase [Methylobacter sp.]|nr:tyrosine-type recombinase/integrase [Methylobacter sp.]MDP2097041.1 tyrosine-type recombinase/integrase [Methylobacter sp.]MDP2429463.1 tyrosine-type recombinase/integrase [Methylobacter sp.]MDP3055973.1 tyrosine-type recombinase/integrase [Methylobacter sp.]MDP3361843.1 tyrosine-type recombinase/integrase [Methylobacter sp.]
MALTDTEIRKFKATGKDYQKADSKGLVLVIREAGGKFWRGEFRLDGKKCRYGYGNYPQISLDNARKIHTVARELIAFGKHPAALLDAPGAIQMIVNGHSVKEIEAKTAAIKELATAQAMMTFGDAADKYKTEWVNTKWKDPEKGWSPVKLHLLPKLAELPLEAIDITLLRELIYDLRENKGVAIALLSHGWADRIFGYAVEHDYCKHNPAALIKAARVGKRNKRTRWLSSPEIKRYLTGLYQSNCYRGYKLALHLLLMLALRKSELCGASWSEIDFDKGEMLIPAARMKTKKDHLVMLPTQAIEMLLELQRLGGGSPWVMPMPTDFNRAMHGNNLDGAHNAALAGGDIIDYNIHDHRHTASTHLREQGHSPEVVETALSHAIPGMAGTYSHAQYKTQRLEMLQSWANFLDGIMTERTVIQATFRKAV